jgi:hypothetical protein
MRVKIEHAVDVLAQNLARNFLLLLFSGHFNVQCVLSNN